MSLYWNLVQSIVSDTCPNLYLHYIVILLYVTVHNKTNHIALSLNLRYEPNKLPIVIIINFHFLAWIEESFLYTKICFVASITLYLPSYGSKKSAV